MLKSPQLNPIKQKETKIIMINKRRKGNSLLKQGQGLVDFTQISYFILLYLCLTNKNSIFYFKPQSETIKDVQSSILFLQHPGNKL